MIDSADPADFTGSAGSADAAPIAKICGEPIIELPQDLYIPPDALEVFLDTFQGPLDLLLYLIRKHNLEILDIPMAELTRQYMTYVEMMQTKQLELAAEYLLMTALLIDIKSRMLLPKPIAVSDVEEDVDPRAELVRRLLEYEQMKQAATRISALPQVERDFTTIQVWMEQKETGQPPSISIDDLRHAWIALITRAKNNRHHQVSRETLSVRAYMSQILRRLSGHQQVSFYALFSPTASVSEVVVIFLAILELAKETLVKITQPEVFGDIYVCSTETH